MDDPNVLKQQAAKCRRLLAEITDIAARESLNRLAEEYDLRSCRAERHTAK